MKERERQLPPTHHIGFKSHVQIPANLSCIPLGKLDRFCIQKYFFNPFTILLTQTHVLTLLKIKLWKKHFLKNFQTLEPPPDRGPSKSENVKFVNYPRWLYSPCCDLVPKFSIWIREKRFYANFSRKILFLFSPSAKKILHHNTPLSLTHIYWQKFIRFNSTM